MKKSKHSEEQIIGYLKQVEAGIPLKDMCRKVGVSEATFYNDAKGPGSIILSCAENTSLTPLTYSAPI